MRKILPMFLAIALGFGLALFQHQASKQSLPSTEKKDFVTRTTPTLTTQNSTANTSVFEPYWSIGTEQFSQEYDEFLYFGITVNETGIDTNEEGYKSIDRFLDHVPEGKQTFLVLRLVNTSPRLLENGVIQKNVISQTIATAKEYNFDGVVLDLEIASLPFESVITKVNTFVSKFGKNVKDNKLSFYLALYGDSFYRARPYDVKTVTSQADKVLLMAYDFHKARGNPGPNFPLRGKNIYGYDFEAMVDDFSKVVPKEKLVVIFGLFGYDWTVDDKNRSTESLAKSLSYAQMQQRFISSCLFKDCHVSRDTASSEMTATYRDEDGEKHRVWFEDMESVAKKKELLKEKGILQTSYWAYSYF